MKGTIPAILIDSKKTWKIVQMIDDSMKKLAYKDVKNKLFLERGLDEYVFMTPREYEKRFRQIGDVRIIIGQKR